MRRMIWLAIALGAIGFPLSLGRAAAPPILRASNEVWLVPDADARALMAIDAFTGAVIEPRLIADAAWITPRQALIHPDGERILVLDQVANAIFAYSLEGAPLGVFAPSGGVNTAILANGRAMAWHPNGNLLVAVGAGPNASSVIAFDANGAYQGQFIAAFAGELDSPFDVFVRQGDILVSSSGGVGGNDRFVRRYHRDTGQYLGPFALVNRFPQQIAEAANGNLLIANFLGNQPGILEYSGDLSATLELNHANPAISAYRGAAQLGNGDLLVSGGSGVFQIDAGSAIVDAKTTGSSHYIERATLPNLPDLALSISAPRRVVLGATFSATLSITNTRGFASLTTSVTATLPANLSLISAAASQGTCGGAPTVCMLGMLPAHRGAAIDLMLRGNLAGSGSIRGLAGSGDRDVNSGNDAAATTVEVAPEPIYRNYAPLLLR